MISALLLLGQTPAPHGPEPGPRAALAGLAGFQTVSRVDFGPSSNRLTAVYTLPDRARWHFENYTARQRSEHQYFYRLGELVRAFEGSPSRDLGGAERDALVLQMELRRAAMLWPDGFVWEESASGTRTAEVFLDSCCREGALGTLVVSLVEGRPGRLEARDREGALVEALEVQTWQEHAGRAWPRTLTLTGGHGSFTETVESIETQVHFLELGFVPPDRRELPGSTGSGPTIRPRDILSMTYSARPLPEGTSWSEVDGPARERIAKEAEVLARLGLEVDPIPMIEVDREGRPVRQLLRLSASVLPAPTGFVTVSERPGIFLLLEEPQEVTQTLLERLHRTLPAGARPDLPYVRLHSRDRLAVELVLPFGSER